MALAARQTPAERAAFALEAAAMLDAQGIDVLADLTRAYNSDCAPMPHRQRYLYAMMRHLERARTAQAIAAREAAERGGTPGDAQAPPAPPAPAKPGQPDQPDQPDTLAFLNAALGEAERELLHAARARADFNDRPGRDKARFRLDQIWQCTHYHLWRVQAQMERLPGQNRALAQAVAERLALSRQFAAGSAPPSRLLPLPARPDDAAGDTASAAAPVMASTGATPEGLSRGTASYKKGDRQLIEIMTKIIAESDGTSINRKNAAPPGAIPAPPATAMP